MIDRPAIIPMMRVAVKLVEHSMDTLASISLKLELWQAKARHMRLVDTKDWAGYEAMLTEDFTLDLSEGTNIPVVHGRDAAMKLLQAALGPMLTVHHAHLPEIELRGTEALVVWPIQDRVLSGPDKPSSSSYTQHHERWLRRDGQWLLAWHRRTVLHTDVFPPAAPAR
jgi:hypothetical protein